MARGYTEYKFNKRKEEGEDVEELLRKKIPGDGESPLDIAHHAIGTLYKFILGVKNPEINPREIEFPIDEALPPSDQIVQAYELAIDELTELGKSYSSLDDPIIHPFTKKEVKIREAVRFFVFHLLEHAGQIVRFQHHLLTCRQ